MVQGQSKEAKKVTFSFDKSTNFSEWFSEIVKRAELADLRYNVKGFVVFQPWSVLCMEAMYKDLEEVLQNKGHSPYWFPAVIPEKNFKLEGEHVQGFTPSVLWVTSHGNDEPLEEKLALRPTSETAFYQMFALWLRSYKDLPFKTYQRAQVWRYETKATRPFLRSREFHWIEAHCAFPSQEQALQQVHEDMETTQEVLYEKWGLPFIFFRRPQWDKFAGAVDTYAADAFMPDGRFLQLPSTHNLGQNFSKPFNVQFTDKEGKQQYPFLTCYGPAVSRIFAGIVAVHSDNRGLVFPFDIAPKQIVIVPIVTGKNDAKVLKAAKDLHKTLLSKGYRVELDASDKRPGEKFFYWEMKGVPLRLELGPKELAKKSVIVYRRDADEKKTIKLSALEKFVEKSAVESSKNLKQRAEKKFKDFIKDAKSFDELKQVLKDRHIARVSFCSNEMDGASCAEKIEKELQATVRGTRADKKEKPFSDCIVCGNAAKEVAYVAFQY